MSAGLLAALSEVSRIRSQAACCGLILRVSPFLKKRSSPLWRIRLIMCNLSLITYQVTFARIFAARLSRFWLLLTPTCRIASIPDGIHSGSNLFRPGIGAGNSEAVLPVGGDLFD